MSSAGIDPTWVHRLLSARLKEKDGEVFTVGADGEISMQIRPTALPIVCKYPRLTVGPVARKLR
eukprot:12306005-Heterocapsa_arctica.AAC.1